MRVLAWALYDLANTFFAVAMLTFYFPLWVIEDRGAKELSYSLAVGISMACVALIMPFCGALSDARGERVRLLRWTTFACAACTLLIGFTADVMTGLILFGVANVFYQLGTVFYDALLWKVTGPDRLGQTSGLGAAFGYLGSMVGLLFLWPFVRAGGYQAAFVPSAVFFLLFALPCFLLIRETPSTARIVWGELAATAMRRLVTTVRSVRALGGLWRFFWATFFSMNAIYTVLFFMAVYTRKVAGFSLDEVIRFFLFCQVFTVAGSLVFGQIIPRWGPKRTLSVLWLGWIGALAVIAVNPSVQWLWIVGPVFGFCLGSTFATTRVLLIELAPKDRLAEMVGLAGLFGKASAIVGPLVWGVLVLDPTGYRRGFLFLIALLVVGLWLLQGVPAPQTQAARSR